ncbi:hypothetical protein GE09DRAFT_1220997 [Coniochaeta sp. 2T2.1]|nr:hypothetical protein GE09DRAFT_1220997 [Coniochaeta sp. 2T2.1]
MARTQLDQIHIAVLRNELPRVRALLRRKRSRIDLADNKGATPLMLAALMGMPKMVTFLLKKGASWQLADRNGHVACDYVLGTTAEHMKIRYKGLMKTHAAKSLRQRRAIYEHLTDRAALKTQYRTKPAGTLKFQRRGTSLGVSKLIAKVKLAGAISQNRTAACITPGDSLRPKICAVSGWASTSSDGLLDGEKYTQIVRDMAEILGIDLKKHCYDTPGGGSPEEREGNVGRFNASHAEKLLGAFWVCEQLIFAFGSLDLSRLHQLKDLNLPPHRQSASLYLDHRPCIPCRQFLAAIQYATGIKICPFTQTQVREVSRGKQATGTCKNCSCAKCKKAVKKSRKATSGSGRIDPTTDATPTND